MKTVPRLSEDGADSFETALLRSARADGASANREKTLAALAIACAAGATGATTVVAAQAVIAAGRRMSVLKWALALLGLGVIGGVAGVAVFRHRGAPPTVDRAVFAPVAAPALVPPPALALPLVVAPEPTVAAPIPGATAERTGARFSSTGKTATKASPSADTLLEEVSIVDRARQQLVDGDGIAAAQTARAYLVRFPRGRLAGEAEVIRIRAALLTGGSAVAAPLAAAFLRAHPDSPHAPALRKIVRATAPGSAP
ncbi:MAG TPA: hypothetical protein VGL59_01760 [Polyangia bacterium]|jgi:hypothetical protein